MHFLNDSTLNPSAFEPRISRFLLIPSLICLTLPIQQETSQEPGDGLWFWLINTHGLIFLTEKGFFFFQIMFNILVAVVETFVLWRISHSRPRVRFLSGTLNVL